MFHFLAVLTIASVAGLQTWRTLFNNFAVEIAHLEGNHIGMIQSVREIPGFLALLAIFIIMVMREHRLSALSIFTMGVGVAITGFFPSYTGLIFTTLIMSFGFHYYETTNQSLTLQYFDQHSSPWVFGNFWNDNHFILFTDIYCSWISHYWLRPLGTIPKSNQKGYRTST